MNWEIACEEDGTFTIRKDRRIYTYEDDLDMALREVSQAGGKEVTVIQLDGYRDLVRV